MCASMADIHSATAEIRRGKKEERLSLIGGRNPTWINSARRRLGKRKLKSH